MENTCTAQGLRNRGYRWFRIRLAGSLGHLRTFFRARQGAAELRAMDSRELHDLGLDRGGIAYAAMRGRSSP